MRYFYAFFAKNKKGEFMEIKKYLNLKNILGGVGIGIVNGLLGSGGGMLAVPVLKKLGFSQSDAQANAIAVVLPISVMSVSLYLLNGYVSVSDALIYVPGGVVGALIGTFLLKKLSPVTLKKFFGAFMVFAGVRLLIK